MPHRAELCENCGPPVGRRAIRPLPAETQSPILTILSSARSHRADPIGALIRGRMPSKPSQRSRTPLAQNIITLSFRGAKPNTITFYRTINNSGPESASGPQLPYEKRPALSFNSTVKTNLRLSKRARHLFHSIPVTNDLEFRLFLLFHPCRPVRCLNPYLRPVRRHQRRPVRRRHDMSDHIHPRHRQ